VAVTSVLLLGQLPAFELFPHGGLLRSIDPEETDPPALLELVTADVEDHGRVLVVYPEWDDGAADYHLRMLRSALETTRLAALPSGLPPLALSVLGAQLAALASLLPAAGPVASGAANLGGRLAVGAWTGSVSRLEHPAPTVSQHFQSWSPGSHFTVTVQPSPTVRRTHRRHPEDAVPWVAPSPSLTVLAGPERDVAWARDQVVPQMGPTELVVTGATPLGPRWWGTSDLVEVVSCYSDVDALAREVSASFPCSPCDWCGEPVSGPNCPFCSMVQRWSEEATAAEEGDEEAEPPAGPWPGTRSVA
jgi:hypothetical protein